MSKGDGSSGCASLACIAVRDSVEPFRAPRSALHIVRRHRSESTVTRSIRIICFTNDPERMARSRARDVRKEISALARAAEYARALTAIPAAGSVIQGSWEGGGGPAGAAGGGGGWGAGFGSMAMEEEGGIPFHSEMALLQVREREERGGKGRRETDGCGRQEGTAKRGRE